MKIITRKQSKYFGIFLVISGIGALWLTFWWLVWVGGFTNAWLNNDSLTKFSAFYYAFNSFTLIVTGSALLARRYQLYSLLSYVLAASVTSSFFIPVGSASNIIAGNLFVHTTSLGMSAGATCGGTILVPAFLLSVYSSLFMNISYNAKRLAFNLPQDTALNQAPSVTLADKIINK